MWQKNLPFKFHTRLSVWKIITLPALLWECEREGSDSCSSVPVDFLTLQTDRWTMFCHENNALYYIYDSVLSSRFKKNITFEYRRECFLHFRMKRSYSSPAEEEIENSFNQFFVGSGVFSSEVSEKLWSFLPCRYSKAIWTWSWVL